MAKATRDPFEVRLSAVEEDELTQRLVRDIIAAEDARITIVGDNGQIDKCHEMYEGGKPNKKMIPWPGAANLGSFIVTEKVDALRARVTATIFTDPIWIVDGWGASAEKAPFVELFHQWKAEQERLQYYIGRLVHNGLIEGTGVLEISDRVVLRAGKRKIKAVVQLDPETGRTMLDDYGMPQLLQDPRGKYVETPSEQIPYADTFIQDVVRATNGPSYRVLSLKNFLVIPGHACEREDIRGYAKRVYRALPELQCRERDGYYRNIEELGKSGERDQTPQELRQGQDIAQQYDKTAEKEIWEVTYLDDLDKDGYEEWYVVTISTKHRKILRIQYQDYGTPHYVLCVPFPRPNSVYGYSLAWDKLGSLYDEHAALRNMFADRSTLATSAPFLQIAGSPWNPALRPFGPREVIPVRDLNELKQLEIRDVPQSVFQALQMVLQAAERISGMNDLTLGVQAAGDRTLGENRIATEQSFIRIDEIVKNFQEGLEDLFNLRQIIWVNKLEADPEPMPSDLLLSMTQRGITMNDQMITADLLRGAFHGKPRGSVESADLGRMRNDFVAMMTALTQMAQSVPALGMHLNNPRVVRSMLTQVARMYRWADKQGLLADFSGAMPMPPGAPGGLLPGPQLPTAGAPPGEGNTPKRLTSI